MSKHPKKSMKSRKNEQLLACLFDSNCNSNSHTNHGVVACTDQAHPFGAAGASGREDSFSTFSKKSCNVRPFCHISFAKSCSLNTSFQSLLNALYYILTCSRMGFWKSSKDVCIWLQATKLIRLVNRKRYSIIFKRVLLRPIFSFRLMQKSDMLLKK